MHATDPATLRAGTAEAGTAQPQHRWLVLVDDDPEMRRYMRGCLSELGFELVEAGNGSHALRTIIDRLPSTPALVVTDIVMPVLDGLQLKAVLDETPGLAEIPVLLITGEARQHGHGPSLHKPFNARRLRAAVWAALGTY